MKQSERKFGLRNRNEMLLFLTPWWAAQPLWQGNTELCSPDLRFVVFVKQILIYLKCCSILQELLTIFREPRPLFNKANEMQMNIVQIYNKCMWLYVCACMCVYKITELNISFYHRPARGPNPALTVSSCDVCGFRVGNAAATADPELRLSTAPAVWDSTVSSSSNHSADSNQPCEHTSPRLCWALAVLSHLGPVSRPLFSQHRFYLATGRVPRTLPLFGRYHGGTAAPSHIRISS